MTTKAMVRVAGALALGLTCLFTAPSCGTPKTDCASTCKGCCSADGVCDAFGDSSQRCGINGASCKVCTSGQMCTAGSCSGTGGGSGSGGGAGTGGGAAVACSQLNCNGCCDAAGACQVGLSASACGYGGVCATCVGGQTCVGISQPTCTNTGCPTGCSGADGGCEATLSDTKCGSNGVACFSCAATGATCNTTSGVCTGGACGGCRNSSGVCQPGTSKGSCGSGGMQCVTCSTSQICVNAQCVSGGSGGGSGGAGGGGSAPGCETDLPIDGTQVRNLRQAANANGWALVWTRDGSGGRFLEIGTVDSTGAMAPANVKSLVSLGADEVDSVNIAFSGTEYAVVYSRGPSQNQKQGYLLRVLPTGVAVGAPIALPNSTGKQNAVAVAWNPLDSQWGIAWREGLLTAESKFARYSTAGTIVGTPVLLEAGNLSSSPLVWTGQGFAAVVTYASQAKLVSVSRQGAVTASTRIVDQATFPNNVAIASSGTDLAVSFMDDTRGGAFQNTHIRFARLTLAGAIQGTDFPISSPPASSLLSSPGNITWDGSAYVVGWSDKITGNPNTRVFRALINASGIISGSSIQATCTATGDDFGSDVSALGSSRSLVFLRSGPSSSRPMIRVF